MAEFDEYLLTVKEEEWYDASGRFRNNMIAKRSFLVLCQTCLIIFLFREAYQAYNEGEFTSPASDRVVVMTRFLCAVFMHITLSGELQQGFDLMKYALNHPWKFETWFMAFKTGFSQMFVVIILESVNMIFMLKDDAISDIVMNFTALLIISDFDDYLFVTIENTPIGKLVKEGEIDTPGGGKITIPDLMKIEVTTTKRMPDDYDASFARIF